MYNVYNKNDVYYLYTCSTNSSRLIGNKKDLIKFLSNAIDDNMGYYKYPSNWSNKYYDNQNLSKDYTHYVITGYKNLDNGHFIEYIKEDYFSEKEYIFYDGEYRYIDVRIFEDEVNKFHLEEMKKKPRKYYYSWRNKRYQYQGRKYHSGNRSKHSPFKGRHQAYVIDSMFDSEYKEYHFKKIEDSNNPYPYFWDDKSRRVEANWKSQYKVNRQYNIHNNGKNNKTIRKQFLEEFSNDEIDLMLEEDFLKK